MLVSLNQITKSIAKTKRIFNLCWQGRTMLSELKTSIPGFMRSEDKSKPCDKCFLLISMGFYDARTEAVYAKSLISLGYKIKVLTRWDPFVARFFKLFAINDVRFYKSYFKKIALHDMRVKAESMLDDSGIENILKINYKNIKVGKYAASSFMRITRDSDLSLAEESRRLLFIEQLAHSLRAAIMAENILNDIKPDLVFVMDRGYTPVGQLFESCLNRKIAVIQRCSSHKSGSEILKRYSSPQMSSVHHHSLSSKNWECVKKIPWSQETSQKLTQEIESTYKSGDWFSEVGTQFNKVLYSKQELLEKLGLDKSKKTAIIFPHIFWDATFFWGEDLFADYYDWFINVLKVAKENTNLNWIIKIHPANIVKAKRDNYLGEQKELAAVREIFGVLPNHIKLIPPDSDINTFSLFSFADYCLTVRGTTGIESAVLGIKTLTAGTGRYDRLGFTEDFETKEEYLKCIANLQELSSMDNKQIEYARRFAYGIFMLRPINLDILEHGYIQNSKATMKFKFLFETREDFENSGFVRNFQKFVCCDDQDFMDWEKLDLKK